jgi:hypothetical protein
VAILVQAKEPLREVVVFDKATRLRVYLTSNLTSNDGLSFTGQLSLSSGKHLLRVVASDMARNEAEEVVTTEVK